MLLISRLSLWDEEHRWLWLLSDLQTGEDPADFSDYLLKKRIETVSDHRETVTSADWTTLMKV